MRHSGIEHFRSERRTANEKVAAVHAGVQGPGGRTIEGCTNVEALARELNVSRGILYHVAGQAGGQATASKRPGPVVDSPAIAALKKEVVQLKVALADKALEADFFKGALQRVEDRRRSSGSSGDPASTTTSKK